MIIWTAFYLCFWHIELCLLKQMFRFWKFWHYHTDRMVVGVYWDFKGGKYGALKIDEFFLYLLWVWVVLPQIAMLAATIASAYSNLVTELDSFLALIASNGQLINLRVKIDIFLSICKGGTSVEPFKGILAFLLAFSTSEWINRLDIIEEQVVFLFLLFWA